MGHDQSPVGNKLDSKLYACVLTVPVQDSEGKPGEPNISRPLTRVRLSNSEAWEFPPHNALRNSSSILYSIAAEHVMSTRGQH